MLISRLRGNGGCQLPCWWGIMPGQTGAQEALTSLGQFDSLALRVTSRDDDSDDGYFSWRIPRDDLLLDVSVEYDRRGTDFVEQLSISVGLTSYDASRGEYHAVETPQLYSRYVPFLTLSRVLGTYGQPESVSVFADRGMDQIRLSLLYPSLGIRLQYFAKQQLDGGFVLCPNSTQPYLTLWDTGHEPTHRRVMRLITEWEASLHKPLPEAVSMTDEEFFQRFGNDQDNPCLTTPVDLWPVP